jgi:hypothetical protein
LPYAFTRYTELVAQHPQRRGLGHEVPLLENATCARIEVPERAVQAIDCGPMLLLVSEDILGRAPI